MLKQVQHDVGGMAAIHPVKAVIFLFFKSKR